MLFPRVNREDAEKIYTVIHNVSGQSVTTGMGTRYVGGAPAEEVSADGISAVLIDSASDDPHMMQFAGIAKKDIPDDDYGIVQLWGAVDSIYLSNVGTSTTMGTLGGVVNTFLQASPVLGAFVSGAAAEFTSIVPVAAFRAQVQTWQTNAMSADVYCTGYVRAL